MQFNIGTREFELLEEVDRKEIEEGAALDDLVNNNGAWPLIKDFLDLRKKEVEDISTVDTKATPEEVKTELARRIAVIGILNEIENFIKDRIERKDVLASALLPNDNEGVI